MYSVLAPVVACHLRRSLATNSGPLSERRCSGTPFITITSASTAITRLLDQLRSHRIIRDSRVWSSIRISIRTVRPSCVRYQTLLFGVLLLKLLKPPRLIHLQASELLAPAIVRLLGDQRIFAGLSRRLPIRHRYFNLSKQTHDL